MSSLLGPDPRGPFDGAPPRSWRRDVAAEMPAQACRGRGGSWSPHSHDGPRVRWGAPSAARHGRPSRSNVGQQVPSVAGFPRSARKPAVSAGGNAIERLAVLLRERLAEVAAVDEVEARIARPAA